MHSKANEHRNLMLNFWKTKMLVGALSTISVAHSNVMLTTLCGLDCIWSPLHALTGHHLWRHFQKMLLTKEDLLWGWYLSAYPLNSFQQNKKGETEKASWIPTLNFLIMHTMCLTILPLLLTSRYPHDGLYLWENKAFLSEEVFVRYFLTATSS